MPTTWIIAADESRAKVLEIEGRGDRKLVEIDDFINPAGRSRDRELQTDAEPHFSGHGGAGKPGTAPTGGSASDPERQGAVEHSVTVFARELGRYLEKARADRRYDKLILAAPPKFLGALRKELGKEVEKLITDELKKDISKLSAHDLAVYFENENRRTH